MNHSVRAFVVWDADLSDFHRETFGYDDAKAVRAWRAGRRTKPMTAAPTTPTEEHNPTEGVR